VSAVIAWLLQRIDRISSAGGYLRSLTQKAREGNLSIGKLLTVPGVAGPA
jgi:replication initiation protein RepC